MKFIKGAALFLGGGLTAVVLLSKALIDKSINHADDDVAYENDELIVIRQNAKRPDRNVYLATIRYKDQSTEEEA